MRSNKENECRGILKTGKKSLYFDIFLFLVLLIAPIILFFIFMKFMASVIFGDELLSIVTPLIFGLEFRGDVSLAIGFTATLLGILLLSLCMRQKL